MQTHCAAITRHTWKPFNDLRLDARLRSYLCSKRGDWWRRRRRRRPKSIAHWSHLSFGDNIHRAEVRCALRNAVRNIHAALQSSENKEAIISTGWHRLIRLNTRPSKSWDFSPHKCSFGMGADDQLVYGSLWQEHDDGFWYICVFKYYILAFHLWAS